jgi:hypothetical protein
MLTSRLLELALPLLVACAAVATGCAKGSSPAAGFTVRLDWHGAEDKPFYRALLVSPSRASSIAQLPSAFWGGAVITPDELDALEKVLQQHTPGLTAGKYSGQGDEYFVEIEVDGHLRHVSLGSEAQAVSTIEALSQALDEGHRKPLGDVVVRLRGVAAK